MKTWTVAAVIHEKGLHLLLRRWSSTNLVLMKSLSAWSRRACATRICPFVLA